MVKYYLGPIGGGVNGLEAVVQLDLGQAVEQFRAVPVELGEGKPAGIGALYGSDPEIDPYRGMFFFPKSTLKMVLFDETGKIHWTRDLGSGVVPGFRMMISFLSVCLRV